MKGLTFGCDVEYFIADPKKVYPQAACGLFGGTKQEPIQFPDEEPGFMYQEDGCSLELNTPVSSSAEEFGKRVTHMLRLGESLVKERYGNIGSLSKSSGMLVSSQTGEGMPFVDRDKYPQAYVVGCDPDFDAYLFDQRPIMTIQELGIYRYSGGHIHVGYDTDACPRELFVRCMDAYLHPVHKASFKNSDGFTAQRFNYYGYPGIYRPKEYGVEYRPLAGNWTLLHYDSVIRILTKMEDDWANHRDRFYEMGMTVPELAEQIHRITGFYSIPRGHTEDTCGYPQKLRGRI
jgi:hypothetical protein